MSWFKKISMPLPFERPIDKYPGGGYYNIDRIMSEETAEKEKLHRHKPEYLGSGSFGVAAIDPKTNSVVKYSAERNEYEIAKFLFHNPCPCFVKILEEPTIIQSTGKPVYSIVTEKVRELFESEEDKIYLMNLRELAERRPENYLREYENKLMKYPENEFIIKKHQELYECLQQNGYYCEDVHGGNIGFNSQGKLVILDLGLVSKCITVN